MVPKDFLQSGGVAYSPAQIEELEKTMAALLGGEFAGGWQQLDEILNNAGLPDALHTIARLREYLQSEVTVSLAVGDLKKADAATACLANLAEWTLPEQ